MKKLFAALLVAVFFVTGCDDSQYRKAARAVAGISSGLKSIQDANEVAFHAGEIDQDSARAISLAVADASFANDKIVQELKAIKKLDPQSKAQIIAHVTAIGESLKQLNDQGVLHIKNPDAKAKFNAAVGGVEAALGILKQLLEAN